MLDELRIAPRDEILEHRRGRRGEIKRKLFHVSSGSERSGSNYGKIRLTPDSAEDLERQHVPVVTAGCAHILAQFPVPPSKRKRPSARTKRRAMATTSGARSRQLRPPLTYRDAGVDIDAGDQLVENIRPFAKKTLREGVLAGIGGFGALFQIARDRYREPVLVSGTDGVGTKLKLAFELNRHGTIGIDLVAMSVNDILTHGAEPLFFLDYFACGKLDVATATEVVKGIAEGCARAGCALIGGETAEMPGMYPTGEYDLAGFAVGIVEKSDLIDGSSIAAGDVVLGLASSGAHSNGYSLIRKIIAVKGVDLSTRIAGCKLSELILEPTRIYVKPVLKLTAAVRVKGLAHITGGGVLENVPRVLPEMLAARIERRAWAMPALFRWLQEQGNVSDEELFRVFNCGVGMAIVVSPRDADRAIQVLRAAGEAAWPIGRIEARPADGPQVILV
jgi:phosphoribosylformylglycinamidine cyclo-ligase